MALEYVVDATLPESEVFVAVKLDDEVVQSTSFPAVSDGVLVTSVELEITPTRLWQVEYTLEVADYDSTTSAAAPTTEATSTRLTTFTIQVIPEMLS